MIFWLPEAVYTEVKDEEQFKQLESKILSKMNSSVLKEDLVVASNTLSKDNDSDYVDLVQYLNKYSSFYTLMSSADSIEVANNLIETSGSITDILYARYSLEATLLAPTDQNRHELLLDTEYTNNIKEFITLVDSKKGLDLRLHLKAFQYKAFILRQEALNAEVSFEDYFFKLSVMLDEYLNKNSGEYFSNILKHKYVYELQQYIDSIPSLNLVSVDIIDEMYSQVKGLLDKYTFKYSDINYYKVQLYLSIFELYLDNSNLTKAEEILEEIKLMVETGLSEEGREMLFKALTHQNLELTSTFLLTLNLINHIFKVFDIELKLPLTESEKDVVVNNNFSILNDIHPSIAKNLEVKKLYITNKIKG